jgi:hypothetical protein
VRGHRGVSQLDAPAAVVLVHVDNDRGECLADPVLEERGLDGGNDPSFVLLRLPARSLHRVGSSGSARHRANLVGGRGRPTEVR